MSKIYKHCKEERDAEISKCKEEQHENELSWNQVFSYPYLNSLLVGIVLSIIHQTSGIMLVIFYSNEIFMQGLKGNEAEYSARIGSLFVSFVSSFGIMIAVYILRIFGRKPLLLAGVFGIGVTQFLLAYYSLNPDPITIIALTLVFVFIFNLTIKGILWIYSFDLRFNNWIN